MSGHRPPRLAQRIVEGLTGSPHLIGDLEEEFAERRDRGNRLTASLWYWGQALRIGAALGPAALFRLVTPTELVRDLRSAGRSLRRTPGVAIAGAVTLGIGIGGPTAMFGIVDGMFSPLPVPDSERIMTVRLFDPESGDTFFSTADMYEAWYGRVGGFTELGAYVTDRVAVAAQGVAPYRVNSARITPAVLEAMSVRPLIGRGLSEADLRADAPRVALIREDLWHSTFGGSPDALGDEIRIDGQPHTIVGVLPEAFGFPEQQRLWTAFHPSWDRDQRFRMVGRIAEGISPAAIEASLEATVPALAETDPALGPTTRAQVVGYVDATIGVESRTMLRYLTFVVSFLVVIAAANVAALLLARGVSRASEVAVRIALGAGRARVVRQLLIEAGVLALLGMGVGLALAVPAIDWFAAVIENRGTLPFWANFGLTLPVVTFTSLLMVVATLASGIVPALRTSGVALSAAMRSGGARTGRRAGRLLPTLVAIEVMLSCTLLVLSGLVVKGALSRVQRVGVFPVENVMTARVMLEAFAYPEQADREAFHDELIRTLDADTEIRRFSVASAMPGDGSGADHVELSESADRPQEEWPVTQTRAVSPGFFGMFAMELLAGRTFESTDRSGAPRVAIANEAFLRERALGTDVVGRTLLIPREDAEPEAHSIVGVVTDPGVSVDDGRRVAAVFLPIAQELPQAMTVAFEGRVGMEAALSGFRAHVAAIDADLPLDPVLTLVEVVRRENDGGRLFGTLFGAFGLAALALAIVGLHGVVAFTVRQRTRDIGVMRALGAPQGGVVRLTTLNGMRPVLVGLVLGWGLSWLASPAMGEGLFGTDPHDPVVLVVVPGMLLIGSLLAALGPALRAARTDPVEALRAE